MMGHNSLIRVTIVSFPPKYVLEQFVQKLWNPVFCDRRVHKYKTQLRISTKLKKLFLWITSVSELSTLTFLTQKEAIVTQTSAALTCRNFHVGKSAF